MVLEGRVLGHGLAGDARGRSVAYRVRDLSRGANNGVTLARTGKQWHRERTILYGMHERGSIPWVVYYRAEFAEDVLLTVAMNIDQGVCCNLAAQATDCSVLGVMTYHQLTHPVGAWSVGLLAIEPFNQAGTPGKNQLRGVGTGMVAALARAIIGRGGTSLTLSPLDDAAEAFWKRRGFHSCNGTKLCLSSPDEIRRLVQVCDELPDCPADGDCVSCGVRKVRPAMGPPLDWPERREQLVAQWAAGVEKFTGQPVGPISKQRYREALDRRHREASQPR